MWVWLPLAATLGAATVSGVQLVTDRASAHLTIATLRERSSCPRCSTPLQPRDLAPILCFALLRGRCRSCRAPIPRQHFVGEVAGAAAWALTAERLGVSWWLPVLLVAPLALVLPMLPAMRPAGSSWLLAALMPAAGAALLTLGIGGALTGDWALYVTAGLLGTTAMLIALAAVRMGGPRPGSHGRKPVDRAPHAFRAGAALASGRDQALDRHSRDVENDALP